MYGTWALAVRAAGHPTGPLWRCSTIVIVLQRCAASGALSVVSGIFCSLPCLPWPPILATPTPSEGTSRGVGEPWSSTGSETLAGVGSRAPRSNHDPLGTRLCYEGTGSPLGYSAIGTPCPTDTAGLPSCPFSLSSRARSLGGKGGWAMGAAAVGYDNALRNIRARPHPLPLLAPFS